jgi:RHS repeat-associated protein
MVSSLTFKNGSTTRMTTSKSYDNLNRLTSISSAPSADATVSFGYAYNTANQRTAITNADSARWSYGYDSLGQVTSGKRYWSDGSVVAGQQFEYGFDDIGNRKFAGSGGDQWGVNLRYEYYSANNLNQYTQRTVPGFVNVLGSATNTATVTVNNQPTYRKSDYFRAELRLDNSAAPLWQGVTNVAVLNQGTNVDIVTNITGNALVPKLTEALTYDFDGNLLTDSLWTNVWNGENRLTAVGSASGVPTNAWRRVAWNYLPDGRWTERVISTWNGATYVAQSTNRFVWDGQVLLAILDHTNGLATSFVRGLDLSGSLQGAGGVGGVLVVSIATNGNHFCAFDGNGNVGALVSAINGSFTANYEYSPFGETLSANGAVAKANPIRFSTQFVDDVTDDVKYLFRAVRPSLGRWPNRDPIGELGFETLRRGRASLRGDGPNLYLFVGNAPVSFIDAFGLTRVESGTWFPGSISDGVVYWTDVDDGQSGTVTLRRITMAEVEAEMKRLVGKLQGYEKADGCKSRKYEGGFDSNYFEGENQQHQYYLVDGKGPLYADNEINYIGIGLYEAWLCDSLTKAKAIVWVWKLGRWQDVPSEGTMHWLEVGYNNYKTIEGNNNTSEQDGRCCRRCRGESDRR